jgi:hypothetical protein
MRLRKVLGPDRTPPVTPFSRLAEFCPADDLCGGDIFVQRLILELQLVEFVFDHIADRHNANQLLVGNTGRWRQRPTVIFSITISTESSSCVVMTGVAIYFDTASLSAAAP